jgi:hypothetical protein
MVDREARKRIEALEAQGVERDCEIAVLSGRLSRLAATLEALRIEASGAKAPAAGPPPPTSAVSSAAASRSPAIPSTSPPAVLLPPPPAVPPHPPMPKPAVPSVPAAAPAGFASLIVADFPALFAEFGGKRFTLLWRGSRDGFGARDFHGRCDGHANTLTLIKDTAGNIFGGFTPVEWESREKYPYNTADPSLKSFLFTLKNPHNHEATRLPLNVREKGKAILCVSSSGPHFYDISVSDNCNANTGSLTCPFPDSYLNSTGLPGVTFFTGSDSFTVKEIEVFEITN